MFQINRGNRINCTSDEYSRHGHPRPIHHHHASNLPTAIPVIDADLDDEALFEDRPWRRPGADLTDYLNFRLDEQAWREYCTKQRTLREEQATKRRIGLVVDGSTPSVMAKGLHLGTGGNFGNVPGMIPPLPPFLPPPPAWILQQGQQSRDRSRDHKHRGESTRDSHREHRDRDRSEHREHHRESTRDSTEGQGLAQTGSKEPAKDSRSSRRDSRSGRHSSRRSASPGTHPSRTSSRK